MPYAIVPDNLAVKETDGAMIAFFMPDEVRDQIVAFQQALPAGSELVPVEELHLTLSYLGERADIEDLKTHLFAQVAEEARWRNGIIATLTGYARFTGGENGDALVLLVDSPHLPWLYLCLNQVPLPLAMPTHGFIPHITLGYLPDGAETPQLEVEPLEIKFEELVIAWGDERTTLPMQPAVKEVELVSTSKEVSLDDQMRHIRDAFWSTFAPPDTVGPTGPWIVEIFEDYVIVEAEGTHFRVAYSEVEEDIQFAARSGWTEVEQEWKPSETFTVVKDARGKWRWVGTSSSGYKDRDGEWVTVATLKEDVDRSEADGRYGPLRWWHMGAPDASAWSAKEGQPWGIGVDLGWCDFAMVAGPFLVESGTFLTEGIGEAVAKAAPSLEYSLGFHHPPDQPDAAGAFHHIRRFERSLLPRGMASNLLTDLFVTEVKMATNAERLKRLEELVGENQAALVLGKAVEKGERANASGLALKAEASDLEQAGAEPVAGVEEKEAPEETKEAPPDAETLAAALRPVIDSAVKEALAVASAAGAEKAAQTGARLDALTATVTQQGTALEATGKALTAVQAALEDLTGETPRALAREKGYRASEATDNVVDDAHALKEAQPGGLDPSFLGYVTGGNHQAPPPQ